MKNKKLKLVRIIVAILSLGLTACTFERPAKEEVVEKIESKFKGIESYELAEEDEDRLVYTVRLKNYSQPIEVIARAGIQGDPPMFAAISDNFDEEFNTAYIANNPLDSIDIKTSRFKLEFTVKDELDKYLSIQRIIDWEKEYLKEKNKYLKQKEKLKYSPDEIKMSEITLDINELADKSNEEIERIYEDEKRDYEIKQREKSSERSIQD